MLRENKPEILEQADVPEALVQRAYRDLAQIHHFLGDTRFIVRAIRRDPLPVNRILDVGCGTGLVLDEVGRTLGVEVIGADIRLHPSISAPVPIVQADALQDPLPPADIAFSMHLGHHLSESGLVELIRNVGGYCRRFILLDLVRHPLPLALFRMFVAPFVCPIDAEDGQRSIRRSYTPFELNRITASALADTAGVFRLSVASLYVRQVMDISYEYSGCRGANAKSCSSDSYIGQNLLTSDYCERAQELTAAKSQR
jgi:SAM-dependent methyltransferase